MTAEPWSDGWPTPPPRAGAPSLDNGQQSHVTRRDRSARIRVNDAAKIVLAHLVDQAATLEEDAGGRLFLVKAASAVRQCRYVKAHREARCGAYLARPQSCHVRLCPDCERARADRAVRRFDSAEWDLVRSVYWVLTIPNYPQGGLRQGYEVMQEALANLRRLPLFAGGHDEHGCAHPRHRKALLDACRCAECVGCPRCGHAPVRGGVTSVESPWQQKTRTWNLHANLLLDAPWIGRKEMREAWRGVTCNAIRRAECRAAGIKGRVPKCPHHHDEKGRSIDGCRGASWIWVETLKGEPGTPERTKSLREVFKYVTKGLLGAEGGPVDGLDPNVVREVLLATRGRRLVNGFGSLRGIHDDDAVDDELAEDVLTLEEAGVPDLVGLPKVCPFCHAEAHWEMSQEMPRGECERDEGSGALRWIPRRPSWMGQPARLQ